MKIQELTCCDLCSFTSVPVCFMACDTVVLGAWPVSTLEEGRSGFVCAFPSGRAGGSYSQMSLSLLMSRAQPIDEEKGAGGSESICVLCCSQPVHNQSTGPRGPYYERKMPSAIAIRLLLPLFYSLVYFSDFLRRISSPRARFYVSLCPFVLVHVGCVFGPVGNRSPCCGWLQRCAG